MKKTRNDGITISVEDNQVIAFCSGHLESRMSEMHTAVKDEFNGGNTLE